MLATGLGRLKALDAPLSVVRYERRRPGGELVHVDTKKLGRINGIGHRITGRPAAPRAPACEGLTGTDDNTMIVKHFDHVTVCVSDLEAAKRFFGLLGLKEDKSVVISGERFATYMGLDEIEADHVTLVLPGALPRFEVQLLRYRRPEAARDPDIARLDKLGFNHICFAVEDIEAMAEDLRSKGVEVRGELKGFHDRRLFFLTGPDGITVELAQWS